MLASKRLVYLHFDVQMPRSTFYIKSGEIGWSIIKALGSQGCFLN